MKRIALFLIFILIVLNLAFSYSIEELDTVMLQNNPSIRQANETVQQAYLDVKDAKANFQPNISLSGTMTYMVNPPVGQITMESSEILSQMGLGSYANLTNGYLTLYDGMENTMYMGTLSLTQPLFTWGKLGKAVNLYSTAYSAQTFRRNDTIRQAQSELRIRVWSLMYLEELQRLLVEAQELADELVTIAESGYENGMMLKQDYLNARIAAMEVEVRKTQLDAQQDEVLAGLKSLVLMPSFTLDEVELSEEDWFRYEKTNLEQLIALATSKDSDNLNAARSLVEVYQLQSEIAQRSMYGIPDLGLQVSLTYGGSRFPIAESGFRQKDSYGLNLSVGLSSIIWDGGKLMNNLNRAKSNVRNAKATLDSVSQQLTDAVKVNYNSMQYHLKQMAYLELKIENLEYDLAAVRTNLQFGQKSRADEAKKMLEVVTAKSELVAEKIQLVQNVLTLDYLTGVDF